MHPHITRGLAAPTLALVAGLAAPLPAQPTFVRGDINLDGVVNQLDVDQWTMFQQLSKGNSSWADINLDGLTNDVDLDIIESNFGECPK